MGIYLNPGYGKSKGTVDSPIYIDKTEMKWFRDTAENKI